MKWIKAKLISLINHSSRIQFELGAWSSGGSLPANMLLMNLQEHTGGCWGGGWAETARSGAVGCEESGAHYILSPLKI